MGLLGSLGLLGLLGLLGSGFLVLSNSSFILLEIIAFSWGVIRISIRI